MSSQPRPNAPEHRVSRRDFFKRLGAGLAAAAFVAVERDHILPQAGLAAASMASWTQSWFAAHVGDSFTVNYGFLGRMNLKLVRVEQGITSVARRSQGTVNASQGECYLLVFQSPNGSALTQNTYRFAHPQLGAFSLFVVPGKADQNAQTYTAVYNSIRA